MLNLTTCLTFDSAEERDAIRKTDDFFRKSKRPTVIQSLMNTLMTARKTGLPAGGTLTVDGKLYSIRIEDITGIPA